MLRENTEKYKTFTIPGEKDFSRIYKNGEEITKTISHISQFFDSARFDSSSLSKFISNLSEGLYRIKYKS